MIQPDAHPESDVELTQPIPTIHAARDYISALALPQTFDPESDLARFRRREVYAHLPGALTPDQVGEIGDIVGFAARTQSPDVDDNRVQRTQRRAIKWLSSISFARQDETTARSASALLRQDYGLRGKLAAISLWYERNIQN